ncbi:MAG: peptide-binding protein [Planctomycetota bacterium]|nr:peptide-binding protein [Planctomycetota bacterium]
MGERNLLRDVAIGFLLVVLVVELYVLIRQNEHDVAGRMQEIVKAQGSQEASIRGVRETVGEQNRVLKDILEELKKGQRVVVTETKTTDPVAPDVPHAAETGLKPPRLPEVSRAAFNKKYADPKAEEGGTFFDVLISDPGTLNPLTENDATVSDVHQHISEGLATRDYANPDQWVPELATHWEETQTSWGYPVKANAKDLADRINAARSDDAKKWMKASAEADGRLRIESIKLGAGYMKEVFKAVKPEELQPIQWVGTRFNPAAGDKDLPEPAKVMERFQALVNAAPALQLKQTQVWQNDSGGFIFCLPGSKEDAEAKVAAFLKAKEQQGPNGQVWDLEKTEPFQFWDTLYFTFHLRQGVRWHDGTPLTPQDYLFSFKTLKDPGIDCQPSRNYFQDCEKLEALDAATIRFTWRKLFAGAFTASAGLTLVPEHIYRYETANQFNTHPRNKEAFGTGPYKFKEWLPKQRIVLERNEDYWGYKPPFKQIYYRIVSESAVRFQMLKDKKLDTIGLTPSQWVNDVPKPPFGQPHGLAAVKQYATYYNYIGWNGRLPKFADKHVRQALTMSIDRDKILQNILGGMGMVVSGTFFSKGPYNDPKINPWPFDPKRAGELFAEAGWKDTDGDGFLDKDGAKFEIKIKFPAASETGKKVLIAVQGDLKKAGIDCQLDPIEWSVFLDKIKKRDFDAIMLGWSLGWDPDPYQLWHSSQTAGEGSNHCYFVNKEADGIIEQLRKTFDFDERVALCHRFHAILHDEQPYTFMFNSMALTAHNADLRNVYLPVEPGKERDLYFPLTGSGWSHFWYMPKADQRSSE